VNSGTAGDVAYYATSTNAVTATAAFTVGANGPNGIIVGTNTNDSAAAGYVGEIISATVSSNISQPSPTIGTYYDVSGLAVTLTAGDWDVYLDINIGLAWTSGSGSFSIGEGWIRSGASTNLVGGFGPLAGDHTGGIFCPTTGFTHLHLYYRASLSVSTTLKASLVAIAASGSPVIQEIDARGDIIPCILTARRAR
jgi:hypothetical protein